MKEKFKQFSDWLKKVKKQAIITASALVIVCLAVVSVIAFQTKDNQADAKNRTTAENKVAAVEQEEPAAEEADTEEKADVQKEEQEAEDADAEKKDAADQADESKAEKQDSEKTASQTEKADVQKKTSSSSTKSSTSKKSSTTTKKQSSSSTAKKPSSSSSTKKPSSSSSTKKPAHKHNYNIPVYGTKNVYVVDKKAWTETIAVYEDVERSICNVCKADITGNTTEHGKAHMLAGEGGGYHSEWKTVQTGTETIKHPEQGHYEKEKYVTRYKCSCGATK